MPQVSDITYNFEANLSDVFFKAQHKTLQGKPIFVILLYVYCYMYIWLKNVSASYSTYIEYIMIGCIKVVKPFSS